MPEPFPVIPSTITVHLGPPDSDAENVTVNFSDYIKNVALFFPFGVFVPMVFPCLRRISTFLCVSILIIVLVEVLQQLSHVGYFDVDDCVFNFIGSFFGYLAYKAYYFIYTIIKKGKRSKAVI